MSGDLEAFVVDGDFLEIVFVDLLFDHVAFLVFDWLRLLLGDSDAHHGSDWVVRSGALVGFTLLGRGLLFSVGSGLGSSCRHTGRFVDLKFDFREPGGLQLFGGYSLNLRFESVQVPEAFKS